MENKSKTPFVGEMNIHNVERVEFDEVAHVHQELGGYTWRNLRIYVKDSIIPFTLTLYTQGADSFLKSLPEMIFNDVPEDKQ